MADVTQILSKIEAGDSQAASELMLLVSQGLRKLAAQRMGRKRNDHTLHGTALVHETYVRLMSGDQIQSCASMDSFFASVAETTR